MKLTHTSVAKQQAGRTLLELMVALVIGLIVLGSVLIATTSSTLSGQRSDTQSRLNEDAQLLLNILIPQLRMAGYSSVLTNGNSPFNSQAFAGPGIRGCDNGFLSINDASWNVAANDDISYSNRVQCASGVSGAVAFSIMYEADSFNTPPGSTGAPTDCLGQEVAAVPSSLSRTVTGATAFIVENRYQLVTTSGTALLSLRCQGNATGTTPQPLIDGIEQMRVTYGINIETTALPNTLVVGGNETQRYLSAAAIDALKATTFASDSLDPWRRVTSVKLCVMLRGLQADAPEAVPVRDCDGNLIDGTDRFIRKVLRTTVALRNRT